jgi:uncharacterized protein YjbJ (UPF0337 family)
LRFALVVSRNGVASGVEARRFGASGDDDMSDDLTRDGLKNQGEGVTDQVKGRLRNTVGGMTGDTSEQIKGKAEELKGKAQRKIGEKQVDADSE